MYPDSQEPECGFGPCRPSWLSPLAGIRSFIGVFGMLGLFSWSLYTIAVSQISNIEKAFGLSSSETGWMLTTWEIGYLVYIIPASYFSPRAHVPRAIGVATLICGISGFVMALPHFIIYSDNTESAINLTETSINNATHSPVTENLCNANVSGIDEGDVDSADETLDTNTFSQNTVAFILFCISMVLQGMGKAPCYPYSSQYVDDNADKEKTGYYMGIILSISIFGLALGFGIGSAVSNVYVTLKGTQLPSTDSRFIGAWWLGFIIIGVATILIALPMFCFPKRLKVTLPKSEDLINREQGRSKRAGVLKELKDVGKSLVGILRSPVYIFSLVGSCFQVLSVACFLGFEPKYMETQFATPAWKTNIILGVSSILSYSIGSIVGGYVTKRFKMTPFYTLCLIASIMFSAILVTLVAMFMGCSPQDIQNPYLQPGPGISAVADCNCNATEFQPICGDDGLSYFSPCHAGCAEGSYQEYSQCFSIPGGRAIPGMCPTGCNMLSGYAIVKFIINFLDAVASLPTFLVFLRSAGDKHKALALGLSAAITSIAAWLPGPVIGGTVIDKTCLIWNTAATSGKYCAHYNIQQQRYWLHALMIGVRCVGVIGFSFAMFSARKMKHWDVLAAKAKNETDAGKQDQKLKLIVN